MSPDNALDALLAIALVWLAWRVVSLTDLFKAVVLFVVFGLTMALAWVRLEAPDIALAEAAIGTGLTGALLLDAVGQMGGRPLRLEQQGGDASRTGSGTNDGVR
jgi:energy-converting hydrogenase B subunit D